MLGTVLRPVPNIKTLNIKLKIFYKEEEICDGWK